MGYIQFTHVDYIRTLLFLWQKRHLTFDPRQKKRFTLCCTAHTTAFYLSCYIPMCTSCDDLCKAETKLYTMLRGRSVWVGFFMMHKHVVCYSVADSQVFQLKKSSTVCLQMFVGNKFASCEWVQAHKIKMQNFQRWCVERGQNRRPSFTTANAWGSSFFQLPIRAAKCLLPKSTIVCTCDSHKHGYGISM